jgi:hypothetical protein
MLAPFILLVSNGNGITSVTNVAAAFPIDADVLCVLYVPAVLKFLLSLLLLASPLLLASLLLMAFRLLLRHFCF